MTEVQIREVYLNDFVLGKNESGFHKGGEKLTPKYKKSLHKHPTIQESLHTLQRNEFHQLATTLLSPTKSLKSRLPKISQKKN